MPEDTPGRFAQGVGAAGALSGKGGRGRPDGSGPGEISVRSMSRAPLMAPACSRERMPPSGNSGSSPDDTGMATVWLCFDHQGINKLAVPGPNHRISPASDCARRAAVPRNRDGIDRKAVRRRRHRYGPMTIGRRTHDRTDGARGHGWHQDRARLPRFFKWMWRTWWNT